MDGISFDQYPKTYQYVTDYDDTDFPDGGIIQGEYFFKHDNYQGEIVGGSGIARIIVTDDGIYSVSIENAEIIENESNALALLPLDAIQTIILDEIVECNTKYNISENYNKYNSLQLIYFKVGDESGHKISVIPVWCCSYYASDYYNHPIFVNAIDGTIIHYAYAKWAGVDATPHKPRRKFY